MKILYISLGQPDYQCDCVMHGLYSLFGSDLTHTDDYHLMYKEYTNPEILKNISGRGFTIWGNLPEYMNDNSDIENKIKNKLFDFIIFGSIRRHAKYLDLVLEYYPKNKIAFIDGEDDNIIINSNGISLFKRELIFKNKNIYPISFSIPDEKIAKDISNIIKTKKLANYIPSSPGTGYVYVNENDYYNDYKTSFFARTHKKGGWDCMRHYEILGNYCLPHFTDLSYCPENTMTNFPKDMILRSNVLYENEKQNSNEYNDILNFVFEYTKNNLTTKQSALYVIDTLLKLKI
jgi:hypothetical protein